jgi:hypothetical protein
MLGVGVSADVLDRLLQDGEELLLDRGVETGVRVGDPEGDVAGVVMRPPLQQASGVRRQGRARCDAGPELPRAFLDLANRLGDLVAQLRELVVGPPSQMTIERDLDVRQPFGHSFVEPTGPASFLAHDLGRCVRRLGEHRVMVGSDGGGGPDHRVSGVVDLRLGADVVSEPAPTEDREKGDDDGRDESTGAIAQDVGTHQHQCGEDILGHVHQLGPQGPPHRDQHAEPDREHTADLTGDGAVGCEHAADRHRDPPESGDDRGSGVPVVGGRHQDSRSTT